MKKDSFMKGALVATLCIVFSKFLGIIYVIPFHAIIGTNGRALYSYAYNMYTLFLNFSTIGIPLAISKIVSEYATLGYSDAKNRTYKIALKITTVVSLICTVILIVFAPFIAKIIIGDLTGGNTVEDITFVLRVSASALVVVTVLSSLRGYLQGHKYITASSISQVIEQIVRVIIIIVGSYVAMKLWGTKEAIGIAMLGATFGSIVALIYLEIKMQKHKKTEKKYKAKKEEKKITNKFLLKKLVLYTIPFVVVSVAISLFNSIDVLTIIKPLVKFGGLKVQEAEMVLSVISTWGAKLNSIVTSIAAGMVVAILPNITSDFVKKDMKAVNKKVNQALQIVLFLVIPMIAGLSFLAEPVWNIFYDGNELCIQVFKYSITTALFYSLYLNIYTIMQSVNEQKYANIALVIGALIKLLLNVPMIILFSKIGVIPVYYASITVTILAYLVPIVMCVRHLKKKINISFKDTKDILINSLTATVIMLIILVLLSLVISLTGNKLYSLIIIILYAIIGGGIYLFINIKNKTFERVFGVNLKTFLKRFGRKK